ncbi:hypothetical protein QFC19_008712 [Naganishia cerealis]|uniref:Uncharacterized protein n=1 Tax=Naganishia cerealis TaxID=610337 RepID=A0ACC2UZJ5_9TREE|nr:hypothetical protein QFC19_008712 [Naganishia cerealis]
MKLEDCMLNRIRIFFKIAARDEAEMKRMSYCGTDVTIADLWHHPGFPEAYTHSHDILQRFPPFFTLEEDEVRELANKGCPTDWINLALHCTASKPEDRPSMKEVLDRLKRIEVEIVNRLPSGKDEHIGSIKITSPPVKIPRHLRNLFSKELLASTDSHRFQTPGHEREEILDDDSEEDEVVEMLQGSAERAHEAKQVTYWRTARWEEPKEHKPSVMELFQSNRMTPGQGAIVTSSVMTIRPSPLAEQGLASPIPPVDGARRDPSVQNLTARTANHSTDGPPSVYHEALSTVDEAQEADVHGVIAQAREFASRDAIVPAEVASSTDGVHRFSLVNQKALRKVEAVKAKKQSACKSSLKWILLVGVKAKLSAFCQ